MSLAIPMPQLSARGSISHSPDIPLLDRVVGLAGQAGGDTPESPRRDPYCDGNLKMMDIVDCPSEVMCVRFSPDGSYLAIGLANGIIKVYNIESSKFHHSLFDDTIKRSEGGARLPVTSLKFVPAAQDAKLEHKHILMATYLGSKYASGMVRFWHYPSGSVIQTLDESRQTLAAAFSPSGRSFVTTGTDAQINLYDLETKQCVNTMGPSDSRHVMNGHRSRVFAVQYHQHEAHNFITGGWDDTVQFWDDRMQHALRKFSGPHICGDSLDIDHVHNHILTGSWRKDNVLQIWDYNSGDKIKDVPQDHLHGSLLYCAQWLGREHILCGGCEHNMARVIDRGTLNTVGQLVDLPNGVYCVDNDRIGVRPQIAVGSSGKVYILKLEKQAKMTGK